MYLAAIGVAERSPKGKVDQLSQEYSMILTITCGLDLLILDDFLLHTISDEREIKILFELLEKRSEMKLSTFICSQRESASWNSMIFNDEVSSDAILKRERNTI